MSKFITALVALSVLCCSFLAISSFNFNTLPSYLAQADSDISSVSSSETDKNQPKSNKSKIKIINGEIDVEPEVKMTKKESEDYRKCKREERSRRSKRNKNKPTACVKKPVEVSHAATDQDYKILIDQIQEQKDVEDKKDLNSKLPLSNFIDTNNVESCTDKDLESTQTSSLNSTSNCASSISSSTSSSSSQTSSSSYSSSNLSISSNSQNQSSLSESTLSSDTSQAADYTTSSSNSFISSQSSSISTVTSESSTTSFLDILFGTVSTEAAMIYSDGYRFPFPRGVKVMTNRTYNDPTGSGTHDSHNAIDMYSVNTSNQKYNSEIVAAKPGKIFLSNASTSISRGLGNNIVIQQDDGNYALYAHLSERYFYNAGTTIKRGQTIGVQGDTGTHDDYSNNSHLHFEVLQPGILNYSSACRIEFNNCYGAFTIDDYKVYTRFDECYVSRGGLVADEPDCTLNGTNQGYPYIRQSGIPGRYWTSMNILTDQSIKSNSNRSFSFDVPYANTADQTRVQIWNTNSQIQQKWAFDFKTNEIVGIGNKCIDAGNISDPNNRWLRIHTCHGGNNQKWFVDQNSRIHSMADESLCIDSANGNNAGSNLYMYPCHDGFNQVWAEFSMFRKEWNAGYSTPMTTIKSAFNSNYVFDIWSGNTTANQQPIKMFTSNRGREQLFQYNSNTKEIKNIDGKCVDAGAVWAGWSQANTYLRTESCHGQSNQKWEADGVGRIHSVSNNNWCIDSAAGDTSGSTIYLSPCHNGANQAWNWW